MSKTTLTVDELIRRKFITDVTLMHKLKTGEIPINSPIVRDSICRGEDREEYNEEMSIVPYLTFTGDAGGGTVGLRKDDNNAPIIYYSFDNENYTQWGYSSSSISLDEGQSVYMYGDNPNGINRSSSKYNKFIMTGKIKASGNIQSLISKDCPDEIPCIHCYYGMFYDCTSLTQAPELSATTLANGCYGGMFYNCTSLTQAPELPATTLANSCYDSMFYGCTSLTQAPELPATTLTGSCYRYMFYGCTSLTQAPELPATTLTGWCYSGMFYNCTSLTQAPELPATKLADSCYGNMFIGCTSLTQAPQLPATKLADSCYQYMFYYCTSLTQAPELPATTLVERCYWSMFYGCSKLNYIKVGATSWDTSYTYGWVSSVSNTGTFVKPANTSISTGTSGIPRGWTVQYIYINRNKRYTERMDCTKHLKSF